MAVKCASLDAVCSIMSSTNQWQIYLMYSYQIFDNCSTVAHITTPVKGSEFDWRPPSISNDWPPFCEEGQRVNLSYKGACNMYMFFSDLR